jgi:hypothetical protein
MTVGVGVVLTGLALLVGWESYAVVTGRQTISEMVWWSTARVPWIRWVGTIGLLVLIAHFWFGWWAPEWAS